MHNVCFNCFWSMPNTLINLKSIWANSRTRILQATSRRLLHERLGPAHLSHLRLV